MHPISENSSNAGSSRHASNPPRSRVAEPSGTTGSESMVLENGRGILVLGSALERADAA